MATANICDINDKDFEVMADVDIRGQGDEIDVEISSIVLTSDDEVIKVASLAEMPDRFTQQAVNELEQDLISHAEACAESQAVESAMHYYEDR